MINTATQHHLSLKIPKCTNNLVISCKYLSYKHEHDQSLLDSIDSFQEGNLLVASDELFSATYWWSLESGVWSKDENTIHVPCYRRNCITSMNFPFSLTLWTIVRAGIAKTISYNIFVLRCGHHSWVSHCGDYIRHILHPGIMFLYLFRQNYSAWKWLIHKKWTIEHKYL